MMICLAATLAAGTLCAFGQADEPAARRGLQSVSRFGAAVGIEEFVVGSLAQPLRCRDRILITVACRFTVFFTVNGLPRNGRPCGTNARGRSPLCPRLRAREIQAGNVEWPGGEIATRLEIDPFFICVFSCRGTMN